MIFVSVNNYKSAGEVMQCTFNMFLVQLQYTVFKLQLREHGALGRPGLSARKNVGQEDRPVVDPAQTLLLNMEEKIVRELALRIRNATHNDVQ